LRGSEEEEGGRDVTGKKKTCNEAGQNGERSLTQMAYRKIKEMMLDYEIIPGQRLVFVDKEAHQSCGEIYLFYL
jgi:hypothetical protein